MPVEPASHTQAAAAVEPAGELARELHARHATTPVAPTCSEKLSAAHAVHAAVPASALCFPAAHQEHGAPLAPVAPARHAHALTFTLASGAPECSGHAEQFVAPASANVSSAQSPHAAESFAPTAAEAVPAAHIVHAAAPTSALCVPAAHSAHGAPSAPVAPAWHAHTLTSTPPPGAPECSGQCVHAAAPAAAYVSCAQVMHAAFPASALYVPAAQAAHGPPSGPRKPALHVQAAPGCECEFAGHARHDTLVPVATKPAAQIQPTALDSEVMFVGHREHVPPTTNVWDFIPPPANVWYSILPTLQLSLTKPVSHMQSRLP